MIAVDQPQDDPTKYTVLLARGNQSQQAEGTGTAVEQATAMNIPLPAGPDNIPSVLGVEIDPLVIPVGFTDPLQGGLDRGDRVSCGVEPWRGVGLAEGRRARRHCAD
jgi:hypothetical protein